VDACGALGCCFSRSYTSCLEVSLVRRILLARLSRLSRMDCITVYVYCYLFSQPPGERSTEVELLHIE